MRVLVVDDDRAVREALRRALTLGGYDVQLAEGGARALELLAQALPDAVVLDVAMPDVDGLEVCRRLRRLGNRTPILMLTARDAVADRIDGLDAGADDYMVKPFDVGELKARLRALLRRFGPDGGALGEPAFAELRLDPARHGAVVGDGAQERFVELTRTEYQLLELLLRNPRQVLTHTPHLRARLGVRLRPFLQRAARLRGLSAAQARAGGGASADPQRAGRRLRPARALSGDEVTLRTRIAAVASLSVALAVLAAAVGAYLAVRADLRGQIDSSLRQRAQGSIAPGGPLSGGEPGGPPPGGGEGGFPGRVQPTPFGAASGYVQFVSPTGAVVVPGGQGSSAQIAPSAGDLRIAAAGRGSALTDRTVRGTGLRVLTLGAGARGAVMVALPLTEVDHELSRLELLLVVIGLVGIALAAVLGMLVARTALAPSRASRGAPSGSPARSTSTSVWRSPAATSWRGSRGASTRRSRRSRVRWGPSVS